MSDAPGREISETCKAFDDLQITDPELFRMAYPRVYREPKRSSYYSVKLPASRLAEAVLKVRRRMWNMNERYEYRWMTVLARYRVPTYYIGVGLMEALSRTQIPGPVDWFNMPMPFDGALFLPPKGTLRHATEGDACFLSFARFRQGEEYTAPVFPRKSFSTGDEMTIFVGSARNFLYHSNITMHDHGPSIRLDRLKIDSVQHERSHRSTWPMRNFDLDENDREFISQAAHYVFATLMVMAARPTLLVDGSLDKRVRHSKHGEREFWTPTVIGENYGARYVRAVQPTGTPEGSHASPRLHWVSGFTRQQRVGPGRTERKNVWVEPFLRGGDGGDKTVGEDRRDNG